jgi:hypothetical protein
MALKTPLRSLVFLYGPYPRILPDADRLKSIGSDLGVGIQELYQKLSALAIIAATPWIAVAMVLKGAQERSLARFLAAAMIVLLLAGSSASLLIHLRYRTQLDPALCAAALVGYRHSKRPKHAFHWYLLCLAGSVIYYLWLA